MKLNTLKPAKGSTQQKKRLGRGYASGGGGTAGKGDKGARSRSGYKIKFAFEGGQLPLQRRVPKFGFKNPDRVVFTPVNVGALQKLAEKTGKKAFTIQDLYYYNLAKPKDQVKILGDGEVKDKVEVEAHKFSKSAKEKIEAAGGKINQL